jgi:hypothetical protein
VFVHVYIRTYVYLRIRVCTYIRIYIHTYIRMYIDIHIHNSVCMCVWMQDRHALMKDLCAG